MKEKQRPQKDPLPGPMQAPPRDLMLEKYDDAHKPIVEANRDIIESMAAKSSDDHAEKLIGYSIPAALRVLERHGIPPGRESLAAMDRLCDHAPEKHIHHLISHGLTRSVNAIADAGGKIGIKTIDTLSDISEKTYPPDVVKVLDYGIGATSKAVVNAGLKMSDELLSSIASHASGIPPRAHKGFYQHAFPAAQKMARMAGISGERQQVDAGAEAAAGFAAVNIEAGYMSRILAHIGARPGRGQLELLGHYSKPLPKADEERARDVPLHAYAYETASLNALNGLMGATGSRTVHVGYGQETDRTDVFMRLWDRYDKKLLESEAKAAEEVLQERLGAGPAKDMLGRVEAKLAGGGPFGPIKSVVPHRDFPQDCFGVEFHDAVTEEDRMMGYQPFKFSVPKKLPKTMTDAFRADIGVSPKDRLIVVGSPSRGEVGAILSNYADIPEKDRPHLFIGARNDENRQEFARTMDNSDIGYRLRTAGPGPEKVIMLDTMGELVTAYGAADDVILGQNRNAIESASQGKHTHYMPGFWGANEMAMEVLERKGAVTPIKSEAQLAKLLKTPSGKGAQGADAAIKELSEGLIAGYGQTALRLIDVFGKGGAAMGGYLP